LESYLALVGPHVLKGRLVCIEGVPAANPKLGSDLKLVSPRTVAGGATLGGLVLANLNLRVEQDWAAPYTKGMPCVTHVVHEGDPALASAETLERGRALLRLMLGAKRPVVAVALTRYRAPFYAKFVKSDAMTEDTKVANLNDPLLLGVWDAATGASLWLADRHDELLERAGLPGLGFAPPARETEAVPAGDPAALLLGLLEKFPTLPLGALAARVGLTESQAQGVVAEARAAKAKPAPSLPAGAGDTLILSPLEQTLVEALRTYVTDPGEVPMFADLHGVPPERALRIYQEVVLGGATPVATKATKGTPPKVAVKPAPRPAAVVKVMPEPTKSSDWSAAEERKAVAFLQVDSADVTEWIVEGVRSMGDGTSGRDLLEKVGLPREAAGARTGPVLKAYRHFLEGLKAATDSERVVAQGKTSMTRYFLGKPKRGKGKAK
jgi:hypothetical protein